ncbi:MAG: crossover junction endodeoxyribonuclease RuvC [Phycisphaerales bacterium]|nr:crossover junction endodeoxyribonuclease RuvC [Phycisphaerales bacterium]
MVRILGIDPGLRLTGYGCIEGPSEDPILLEAGVVRLDATTDISDRLTELDRDIGEVLERLRPSCVAVESLFAHYRHPATAIKMGHARGVLLLRIRQANLPLVELKPSEVKKSLTGHGHASKDQMQQAIRQVFGLETCPEPPDVADALAIALCAAGRHPTRI